MSNQQKILNHVCNFGTLFDKYVPKQNTLLQEISIRPLNNFDVKYDDKR